MNDNLHPLPDREQIALLEPFEGRSLQDIRVVTTPQDAEAAAIALLAAGVVGFDTESKPTFAKFEVSSGPHVVQFATLSEAWDAAADALVQGKTVAEAQATLQQTWKAARAKAFVASVAPEFAKVLPEGAEPKDDAQRAQVVALWKAFATGLKGGR